MPTVVPWTMEARPATGPNWLSPSMKPAASSPRREGTLAVRNAPVAGSNQNRSVKVPPTSTPTIARVVMGWIGPAS